MLTLISGYRAKNTSPNIVFLKSRNVFIASCAITGITIVFACDFFGSGFNFLPENYTAGYILGSFSLLFIIDVILSGCKYKKYQRRLVWTPQSSSVSPKQITSKLTTVRKAYQLFLNHPLAREIDRVIPHESSSHISQLKIKSVAQKVDQFFREAWTQLEKGHNVPLPMLAHATRQLPTVATILQAPMSKEPPMLKAAEAPRGWGLYFSNNIQSNYGEYVFAMDIACLKGTEAWFSPDGTRHYHDADLSGHRVTDGNDDPHESIYLAFQGHIVLNNTSMCCFIYGNGRESLARQGSSGSAILNRLDELGIPVWGVEEYRWIHHFLESTFDSSHQISFPSEWRPSVYCFFGGRSKRMPPHMRRVGNRRKWLGLF